jgi:hypothetical protein
MKGGSLEFHMNDNPSVWGSRDSQRPTTEIKDHIILPSPYIEKGDITFRGSTEVVLNTSEEIAKIYYALNDEDFKLYKSPFTISEDAEVKLYSEKGSLKSPVLTTPFYKIDPNLSIKLESEYTNQYSAGGNDALIDGIRSTKNYRTGSWQGYWNTDVIATVDLGSVKPIYNLKVNFLRDQGAWIFLPKAVDIFTSVDGNNFQKQMTWKFNAEGKNETIDIETVHLSKLDETRFVKIIAKKLGGLPEWHIGHPMDGKSWIFIDEISIK